MARGTATGTWAKVMTDGSMFLIQNVDRYMLAVAIVDHDASAPTGETGFLLNTMEPLGLSGLTNKDLYVRGPHGPVDYELEQDGE